MVFTKKFFCPVNGWNCPYWKEDGSCAMVDEGDNPVTKCYDAGCFWDDLEDAFVWEDENGNRYDVQELLERGFHFINGEPVLAPELAETMKIVAEILKSPPIGMKEVAP